MNNFDTTTPPSKPPAAPPRDDGPATRAHGDAPHAHNAARRVDDSATSVTPSPPPTAPPVTRAIIEAILDQARWAPSGDNTQPWRFEIVEPDRVVIHGHDTRRECVYDLRGGGSQLAIGALLETITIAATEHGLSAEATLDRAAPPEQPRITVRFAPSNTSADALADFIRSRVTQRRPMHRTPLHDLQRETLRAAVPPGFEVVFFESAARRRMANLLFRSALIRLSTREAFDTHRRIIEWNATYSDDRIPDRAVGLDRMTIRLMRWAMRSWRRVRLLNRFAFGTVLPRIELDWLPGVCCAAHFVLLAPAAECDAEPDATPDELSKMKRQLAAGRAVQRFWLTATQLGLQFQPEMTPLIFAQYVRDGVSFTRQAAARRRAAKVRDVMAKLLGPAQLGRAVFLGRLGVAAAPVSRSLRRPLGGLIVQSSCDDVSAAAAQSRAA